MKNALIVGSMFALLIAAPIAFAQDVESSLKPGERIGAYTVEKVCGNATDGVEDGEKLCYRCKLGNRPVITIFARKVDDNLATLVKQLDGVVASNQDKKMASFVNLIGDDVDSLKKDAKKLIDDSEAKHIAVVVPTDHKNGPENLKISDDAAVTVLVYNKGTVEANHALCCTSKLDAAAIAAIVADADKILN